MKLSGLAVLVMPITVLILAAIAVSVHAGRAGPLNPGPHGFAEILYTFTSEVNTNGSAFGGLGANSAFYNVTGSIGMLVGRYGAIIPTLALAGVLARSPALAGSQGKMRCRKCLGFGVRLWGLSTVRRRPRHSWSLEEWIDRASGFMKTY